MGVLSVLDRKESFSLVGYVVGEQDSLIESSTVVLDQVVLPQKYST